MPAPRITSAQVRAIRSTAHGRLGWSSAEYHRWLLDRGGPASTLSLTRAQAANVLDMLIAIAAGAAVRVWHVNQATILQQNEIARLAEELGLAERIGGIVRQTTRGRTDRVSACEIWEARAVIEALKDVTRRRGRRSRAAPAGV